MKQLDLLLDVLDALGRDSWREIEVFHKRGRSRTLRLEGNRPVTSFRQEEGWAVRAGDSRRSFFYTASGQPRPDTQWPEADGHGLRLPSARPVPSWTPPMDLNAPLLSETEAGHLLQAIGSALSEELPGSRLIRAYLEDGSSDQLLVSSREVRAEVQQRAASLFVEAQAARRDGPSISMLLAEREARRFTPSSVARQLADRLLLLSRGSSPSKDRGQLLLSHGVMSPLIHALSPLWLGPEAGARARLLTDRQGHLASRHFSLVDDGRFHGGVLESPVDGEGQPTRKITLVEEGVYRQPLVSWRQATGEMKPSGCCRRFGWRDLPSAGPTHLHMRPDPNLSVGELLGGLSRGYYLLSTHGAVKIEDGFRRFAVPVSGFAIDGGRPTGSVTGVWLTGSISTFFKGMLAAARDLTFMPLGGGMIGAPTVLIKGLELRQRS